MNPLAFFKPAFLWGLLFLAVPLIVHLLRRPRVRVMAFSTLRFFQDAAVTATRMRRLRNLLLLLARLLAVAAVVMLFARPYDARDPLFVLRDPHLSLFTWIDPTPSMGYSIDGLTLYERGVRAIDSLRVRSSSSARHLDFDEPVRDFVMARREDRARSGMRHGRCGLGEAMRVWNVRRREVSLPVLMLASDFQRETVAALDSFLIRHEPAVPVICLALGPERAWNYAVQGARMNHGPGTVAAQVSAQGRKLDSARVEVMVSGVYAGARRCSLDAGDTVTISLATPGAAKAPGGTVSLAAGDPLAFDNTCCFTADERASRSVVVLGKHEAMFPVAAAYRAIPGNRYDPVDLKTVDEATYDLLDSAALVVVGELDRPTRWMESFLFASSAGNAALICAFADNDAGLAVASSLISRMATIETPLRRVEREEPVSPVLPDTLSDLWRLFPRLVVSEAAVYRYMSGLPGTPLLRLENGAPLITSLVAQNGRPVILVATPLGITRANNLCETGFFIPSLDRISLHATQLSLRPAEAWIAGIDRRNPFFGSRRAGMVFDAAGELRERWQTQRRVVFSVPGLYRIAPEGDRSYWVAVNADPQESRMEYPLSELNKRHKDKLLIINEKELLNAFDGTSRLLSYLPWLLLLLFLLTETLLWEKKSRADK